MRHAFLDEYSNLDSPLHRIPAKVKIINLLIFVILVALTSIKLFFLFIFYFFLVSTLVFISRVSLKFFIRRIISILPFIILVAVSLPFIKKDGWSIFAGCILKALLISLSILLVTATTRFNLLLGGLKELKFPHIIVMLISFMYRYLFILEDEFLKRRQAFESRNIGTKKWIMFKSFGNIIGSLFIHTYERAERIYLAMCARGYNEK